MTTPICLICGNKIPWLDDLNEAEGEKYDQLDGGGNVTIAFYYGSRHDMGIDITGGDPFRGYICDDCFDKVKDRLNDHTPPSHS